MLYVWMETAVLSWLTLVQCVFQLHDQEKFTSVETSLLRPESDSSIKLPVPGAQAAPGGSGKTAILEKNPSWLPMRVVSDSGNPTFYLNDVPWFGLAAQRPYFGDSF